jgi:hypothetical protein
LSIGVKNKTKTKTKKINCNPVRSPNLNYVSTKKYPSTMKLTTFTSLPQINSNYEHKKQTKPKTKKKKKN